MTSGLIFVAASGLALEAAESARAAGVPVRGCLDDNAELWGSLAGGWLPVLGGLDVAVTEADSLLVLAAGHGRVREALARRLAAIGVSDARYATVVHPSVTVPPSCRVGHGSVLLAGVVLTASVTVGRHVVAMPQVTLTHDNVIGDFVTLCAGTTLGGYVEVGRGAYLGMKSSVRERARVGEGATLGMGAALLGDLPEGQAWAGVPARPLSVPLQPPAD